MIKFDNTEVLGWEHAIRGMRNPLNSWNKSDTTHCIDVDFPNCEGCPMQDGRDGCMGIGENPIIIGRDDMALMRKLRDTGTDHRKFMRMIAVYVDVTAPLYWWKEFDTYKIGTVANSCSTMHKIADKEFTLGDFSCEHLIDYDLYTCNEAEACVLEGATHVMCGGLQHLQITISVLNFYRRKYLETKEKPMKDEKARQALMKRYWWQMIQLLPSSYNQRRTVMLNYEVLVNMYKSRKNHKLDEWRELCEWIKTLPYHELIIGGDPTDALRLQR